MTKNNRETWLNQLAELMAPRFAELGHPLPSFRVSVGFPSAGMKSASIGECWDKSASGDKHFEIFLRPDRADSLDVAATLAHELVHTAVGLKCGHTGLFARVARSIGLAGKLTATTAGPAFVDWTRPMLEQLGQIPHAALSWRALGVKRGGGGITPKAPRDDGSRDDGEDQQDDAPASSAPKTQTTRLRKACCADCGYTVRVTSKWLEIGPPHCPLHGAMAVEE